MKKATAARKRYDELYFISTELVFLLERFAQRCGYSANESGDMTKMDVLGLKYSLPEINFESITGDWRSLPPGLMYRLAELPVISAGKPRVL